MKKADVHEVVRQPLERVDTLAEHQGQIFVIGGWKQQETSTLTTIIPIVAIGRW